MILFFFFYLRFHHSAISRGPFLRTFREIDFQGNASGMSGALWDACRHIPGASCSWRPRLALIAYRTIHFVQFVVNAFRSCHSSLFSLALSTVARAAPSPRTDNISGAWFCASPCSEHQDEINVPLRRRGLLPETHLLRQKAGVKTGRPQATGWSCFSLGNGH